ncbi:MAG: hypothetical protein R6V04_03470 [bacterium]
MEMVLPPDFKEFLKLLNEKNVVRMGIAPIRIEILTSIAGVDFKECFKQRVVDTIDGIELNIIDLKHLKLNKKTSGRHKDLDDYDNLSKN